MREIVLVTRKANHNKGNLALSAAWVRLLGDAFPTAMTRTLERGPRRLAGYPLRAIAAQRDPDAAFDRIAERLARLAPGPEAIGAPSRESGIVLHQPAMPLAGIRRRLNLRRLAAGIGLLNAGYRRRLAAFQRADMVVMNAAGEFHPGATDIALMYLLDMRVAQLLGRRTAMVNLSLETVDPALEPHVRNVFSRVDLLHFRDEESRSAYSDMGGDADWPVVVPDLALTTPMPLGVAVRPGAVALAVNGIKAEASDQLEDWVRLVETLKGQGLEVTLVTSAAPEDRAFYSRIQARTGVAFLGESLDYQPFTALLAGFELVISVRMHTGILALAAGRPVIPVEPARFKMAGLFRQLGFAEPPIVTANEGWVEEILGRTARIRTHLPAAEAETRRRVADAVERTRATLIPRLRAALSENA